MIRKKQILFLIFIMAAVLLTSCGQKEDAGSLAVDENISASLTYDHRVVDGMLAGQCLAAIVKSLESMNESSIEL